MIVLAKAPVQLVPSTPQAYFRWQLSWAFQHAERLTWPGYSPRCCAWSAGAVRHCYYSTLIKVIKDIEGRHPQ